MQHTRLPCPSLNPRVCTNSCPLSWWCYSTISLPSLPALNQGLFQWVSSSHLMPKYWSSSISPSSEYSGLISFRIDWFDLFAIQFSSVQLLSRVQLIATPWIVVCQASLSITNSRSLFKFMSMKSAMPSTHFILCRPLLLLPSIFPCIGVFSNESVLRMRCPKYWSLGSSISPSEEYCFQVVVIGNDHKAAAFPPAQLWLLMQPEPEGKPCSGIVSFSELCKKNCVSWFLPP